MYGVSPLVALVAKMGEICGLTMAVQPRGVVAGGWWLGG